MKNNYMRKCLGTALLLGLSGMALAQENAMESKQHPVHRAYLSTGIDGYILSTAMLAKDGKDTKATTPRFTGFFHIGVNLNYDFTSHFGFYTGLNIKNIGFIEKIGDSTIKRRDYTLGIPLGLKIGSVSYGTYLMVGGGVDFPFNYREKGFVNRGDKTKFNEWFSDRTPAVLPYVFIGAHLHPGIALKLQYYPGNFLNPDFEETVNGVKMTPYKGYKVNLIMATLGLDFPYHPKEMMRKMKHGDGDAATHVSLN